MRLKITTEQSCCFSVWNHFVNITGLFIIFYCSLEAAMAQSITQFLDSSLNNNNGFLIAYKTIGTQPRDGYVYQSFQPSMECKATLPPLHPTTIHELQEIVLYALRNRLRVKAVGKLHSVTDCICTDGLVVDMTHIKHFSFDPRTNHATTGAGLELHDLLEQLHEKGRGLTSVPSYGGLTVGGVVGTGAHGTNVKQPASVSDQLVSVTFVDGVGNIKTINEHEEDFKALRVHLGLLGIVYELVLRTTEQYKVQIKNFPVSDDILWKDGEIMKLARTNDFLVLFWFPTNKQVVLSVGNKVPVNASGNCETHMIPELPFERSKAISLSADYIQKTENQMGLFLLQNYAKLRLYKEVPGTIPIYTEGNGSTSCLPVAVGYSHRMWSNRCSECYWMHGEFSLQTDPDPIFIDVRELPGALRTLKEITEDILVELPIVGMHFRFLKESDAYLGLSSGRETVAIEWESIIRNDRTQPRLGIAAFQALGQALVERHGGRPHWGKNGLYYTNPRIIRRAYSNRKKFVDAMKKMDPHELFMNDLGRRIKYGSSRTTLPETVKKRCALNEACLCQRDSDCGDQGPGALVCSYFNGFKVCRKRPTMLNQMGEKADRLAISTIARLTDNVHYVMGKLAQFKGFNDFK